eukprot:scaffold55646_cov29-Tisochrysis_lutea.AAC.3
MNVAASVLTLRLKSRALKKLKRQPSQPRKSAWPPCAKGHTAESAVVVEDVVVSLAQVAGAEKVVPARQAEREREQEVAAWENS